MIRLYNTLSKSKEEFKPIVPNKVGMYNCGPTVYDVPQLGNYRTYVMNDMIRRVFEYMDYKVDQVMNITDVDDKTIRRSLADGITLRELTTKYEHLFLEEIKSLNILPPHHLLHATDNIKAMTDMIGKLIDSEHAYISKDGIYLSVSKVKNYGALIGLEKVSDGNRRSRIDKDEYDKENIQDFALWKFKTDNDGNNSWPSPWGDGRPGWHIECSAMAIKSLGETIDIHTGAIDLMFPHHTNEIAQSECSTGKEFVHYWIHGAFLTVDNNRMGKSKGNSVKLSSLIENSISPIAFRYWLFTSHYRKTIDFTFDAVHASQNALIRLMSIISEYPDNGNIAKEYKEKFISHITDDFSMPEAIALIWEMLKDNTISPADKKATIIDFDRVLGLGLNNIPKAKKENIPDEIIALAEARKEARNNHDWRKADAMRDEIRNRGFDIVDNESGYEVVNG